MDVHERLTFEESVAPTSTASEHRQRYELAARFCDGLKVLDLCCGSGYGSEYLARVAASVTGVDRDGPTVDAANARNRNADGLTFVLADAVTHLAEQAADYEVIVCFEGLEHLDRLDEAIDLLVAFAEKGGRVVASVPNSRTFAEENPFHLADFDPETARAMVGRFPDGMMMTQHMVEGGIITVPGDEEVEVRIANLERAEPEYANHFMFVANCPQEELARSDVRTFLSAAPVHNGYMRGLEIANQELRRINARLSRTLLGKTGAAAAKRTSKVNERVKHLKWVVDGLEGRVRDERERGDQEYERRRELEGRVEQLENIFAAGPLEAAATARRWGR